ncbi:unnamed protein product [Aphanomyces euteiches]
MVGWTNRSLPATLETLDLSYNQGGMAWFSMAQVATSNLTHLYLRGNNLSTIVLTQQTLPPSLTYLDLSDNPNVIVFADRSTYTSLARQQIVLKVNTSLATVSGFAWARLSFRFPPRLMFVLKSKAGPLHPRAKRHKRRCHHRHHRQRFVSTSRQS